MKMNLPLPKRETLDLKMRYIHDNIFCRGQAYLLKIPRKRERGWMLGP